MEIIHIQQRLTDTFVTGYTNGFELAKEHFDNANLLLDKDIATGVTIDFGKISYSNLDGTGVTLI
jgi:hypothetical protein